MNFMTLNHSTMNSIVRALILSLGISTALVLYNHISEVALNFRFVLVGVVLAQWLIKKPDETNNKKQWDWQSLWQKLRSFVNKSESVSPNPIDAVTPQNEPAQAQSVQETAEPGTPSDSRLEIVDAKALRFGISALVKNLSFTDWRQLCSQLGLNGGKISAKDRAEFLLKANVTVEQLQQKIAYLLNSEPD